MTKTVEITPFFKQLSKENQDILLQNGVETFVREGTTLFYEGDEAKSIYLIKSGKVRLSKMTIDHKRFFLHLKQEHEIVGEFSLFNDMSVSMTAEVIEDSKLIKFNRDHLEALFLQNGEIAVSFIKLFARNTQSTQAKFSDLLLYGKVGALYSILIRFSNSYGVNYHNDILLTVKLTNQDIANYIGTSRETTNRMLQDLKKDKIIAFLNGNILIKNIDYLKNHLRCGKCPVEICTI
ncbi:Crp/Fnr family transcriptional regulator [Anaerobacillus isosaccharinicus]|uniref:Crp/Fnr family transcriptional regulator n=1 Tax=Anaerobacillus isosaccharinicus TaxID=1532552 RepID=A0A1S2L7J4_9BACI|nr:Crp/Fnr family transcriptional regulator [Anaerobacillus isosaccharinicus]MBA5587665.1 Crp/Fnr family transcriptional regulator [Anaerobacillus isosaccharinicus]QOY34163.1 Crp/Fnr family transcriptional regulator [Anaerobacillus isosaccharinicus]